MLLDGSGPFCEERPAYNHTAEESALKAVQPLRMGAN